MKCAAVMSGDVPAAVVAVTSTDVPTTVTDWTGVTTVAVPALLTRSTFARTEPNCTTIFFVKLRPWIVMV